MKTCPDCGERIYNLGCVNCNEQDYINEQERLTDMQYPTVRNVHESAVSVMLRQKAEREHERARIARILDEFSRAPLSMASVQPLLDLAVEMNPRSKETK